MTRIYAKLFLSASFWGATFVAARVVSRDVAPYSASFLRFVMASLCLVALLLICEGGIPRLRRHQVLPAILLGMTGVVAYNVLFFLGMQTIAAGRASLIVATNPVFTGLLAALLFREPLNRGKVLGTLLGLAGAVLVISRGDPLSLFAGAVGRGELYIAGTVASWVAYTLVGKLLLREMSPLGAVSWSCLIGAAALAPLALSEGLPARIATFPPEAWGGLAFLAFFGTVLGFFWYYQGIRAIGASRAALFINFVPVSGVFFGWLLLDETVNLSLLIGAALILTGVYTTNRPAADPAPQRWDDRRRTENPKVPTRGPRP